MYWPFNDQSSFDIETSQLIYSGFYMEGALVVNGLKYWCQSLHNEEV